MTEQPLCWYCMARPARHLNELGPPGRIERKLLIFCSIKCAASMGMRTAGADGGIDWCAICGWCVATNDEKISGEDDPCPHPIKRDEGEPLCLNCDRRPARRLATREPDRRKVFCGTRCAASYGVWTDPGGFVWCGICRIWTPVTGGHPKAQACPHAPEYGNVGIVINPEVVRAIREGRQIPFPAPPWNR